MRKMRLRNLNRMIRESHTLCRNFFRIDQRTFGVLIEMVRDVGGLSGTRNVCLEEIVAGFLYTLAHHKKNRMIGALFYRSGEIISRQSHACLRAILKMNVVLLKKPTPIPEDCDDDRWKYFKNCLGALDAHDGHVLRDAIARPNGFKVPKGFYYLCDGGYTNGEGFLAPYRGHLYHLRLWNNGPCQSQSAGEYFNLRHTSARNVIERCFGLLKGRLGILRSPSWFSLETHGRIVLACALLQNLVKRYMSGSSDDDEIFEDDDEIFDDNENDEDENENDEYINSINISDPWTNFRNTLAQNMFNNWRARNHM